MNFSQAFDPIRSLKSVFGTMKLQPAHLWGGGILLFFLEGGVQVSLQGLDLLGEALGEDAVVFLVCGGCVLGIGLFLASVWLAAGLFLNFRSVMQTGEATSGGIFDHQGKFLPLLLTRLLVGLASVLAVLPLGILFGLLAVAFVVPMTVSEGGHGSEMSAAVTALLIAVGVVLFLFVLFVSIYVGTGLVLSEAALLYEDRQPVNAVKRSWAMAKGNRLRLFAFMLVNGLFAMAGVLLCCVGIFATATIARFAIFEAFLQLSETPGEGSEALLEA
ncbi:MAG: DUF975 family protein [Planctomycetota bacterium]|nr:DUF975 family protein [Planctomycetota bacterium]